MAVKVLRDGQQVDRSGSYTTVHTSGTVIPDDQINETLLMVVQAGEHPGLEYVDDDADEAPSGPTTSGPVSASSTNADAMVGATPAGADSGAGGGSEIDDTEDDYEDDPDFDPDSTTQPKVIEYLEKASPAEVERVKAAEAKGQDRQQIKAFEAAE